MTEEPNNQEVAEPEIQEPKAPVDKVVDDFLDGVDTPQEKPEGDSSPETNPNDDQPEAGAEPDKDTESKEGDQDYEGVPKGFANHPAWQKREDKLKEAQGKLEETQRLAKERDDLLNDPIVYRRYLEKQGYSEGKVSDLMREKGFVEPKTQEQESDAVELICKRLNWDASALNTEQRAYLKDQVSLVEAVSEQLLDKKLSSRLENVENRFSEIDNKDQMRAEYEEVVKQAKEEFSDLDWEKDIHPAMTKYLEDLDKRDPNKQQKINFTTLYERATRQLLKDRRSAIDSQAERNDKKKNLRTLTPGANPPEIKKTFKGKTVNETVDNLLDSYGIRD